MYIHRTSLLRDCKCVSVRMALLHCIFFQAQHLQTTTQFALIQLSVTAVFFWQYYGHREKLRSIGREGDLEKLNRGALRIAREVADDKGKLMAGNLCVTGVYSSEDKSTHDITRRMFQVNITFNLLKQSCLVSLEL